MFSTFKKSLKFLSNELFLSKIVSFIEKKKNLNQNEKINKSQKTLLVEFNSYYSFFIVIYYLTLYFKQTHKLRLLCFYNFFVIKNNFENLFFKRFYIKLSFKLSLHFAKLYNMIGFTDLIVPKANYSHISQIQKDLNKIKNLNTLLKFKINNTLVGDLLYDTYLKKFQVPTIDIKTEKFKNFFNEFNLLVYFWIDYFKNNKIDFIVGSHLSYSYGIPLRFGKKYKANSIVATLDTIYSLKHQNQFQVENWIFKKKKFSLKEKMKNRKWSLNKLNDIFSGNDLKITPSLKVSSFSKLKKKSMIKKSKKLKVLVLPHDFFDAPHAWGDHGIFTDYFKWLEFISNMIDKTDYEWYIKTHPNYVGNFGINQKKSREMIGRMFKNRKKVTILPSDYSHKQIITEKIDCLISCHGSSLYEYSYNGIMSIASSKFLPWRHFKICIVPKSLKDLENKILNLKKMKKNFKVNKNEILDYFYLRFNYYKHTSWLLPFREYSQFVGGWHKRHSPKIFEYWIKNYKKINLAKKNRLIKSFLRL